MGRQFTQVNTIAESDLKRARMPYWITARPPAVVAAGGVAILNIQTPTRDFVWTHIAFNSVQVGFPLTGMPFRVQIIDLTSQTWFADQRFDISGVCGSDQTISQNPMIPIAFPWTFSKQGTLQVEFQNLGAIATTPTLTFHGFLAETTSKVQ